MWLEWNLTTKQNDNQHDVAMFAVALGFIWRVRNKHIFENCDSNLDTICHEINYGCQELFQFIQMHHEMQPGTVCNNSIRGISGVGWIPPHDDWIKVNCDGKVANSGSLRM